MKRTAVNAFARFCVIVCCSASTLFAEDLFERARSQAIDMTHAFQRHDAKAIVRYTAEPIVKRKGGAEALEKLLTAEFAEMKKDNAKLLKFEFLRPDRVHTSHGHLFVLIERKSSWQYDKSDDGSALQSYGCLDRFGRNLAVSRSDFARRKPVQAAVRLCRPGTAI
jgi:hypothetical protein